MVRVTRMILLLVQGFVSLTALAGGVALMVGALSPSLGSVIVPPSEYLAGSPFASYLLPGAALVILVSGSHAVAFVVTRRRSGWSALWAAAAGFASVIWIFVQMVYIPFSPLQALYLGLGLLELGLTLVLLGVSDPAYVEQRLRQVIRQRARTG